MALINITPVMTSNTVPTPYVVSASGIYGTGFEAYRAFDNDTVTNKEGWVSSATTGWIKFDFGVATKTNAISIFGDGIQNTASPKDFIVYGSNDDISYEKILDIKTELYWGLGECRLYNYSRSYEFRYYKIIISANNGHTSYVSISEIKFWQDDGVVTYITNKTASMDSCLPNSTTLAIKQKKNDPRVGRLGYANDDANFGTLWIVNKVGESQLAKAALAPFDILFNGNASTAATYSISGRFSDYKSLSVKLCPNNDSGSYTAHFNIDMAEFLKKPVMIFIPVPPTGIAYLILNYISDTQFSLSSIQSTGYSALGIGMIKGIR
jgi:hypothetical protein